MAAVSLTTLRSRVRERADLTNSQFVTDASTSVDAFINEGIQRVHEKLVEAYGEEYVSSYVDISTLTPTAFQGGTRYTLPTDFFKLYGVDLTAFGRVKTLKPYMRAERNAFRYQGVTNAYLAPRYRLTGNYLHILPAPGADTGTLYYAPVATALSAGSDTVNFPNGWERMVVLYAAAQCLIKEESDPQFLMAELAKQEAELETIKQNRDAAMPRSVVDLDNIEDWYPI